MLFGCRLHKVELRVTVDWKSFGSGEEEEKHPGHLCTNPRILLLKVVLPVDLHLCLSTSLSVSPLKPVSQEESRLVRLLQGRQRLAGGQDGVPAGHQTCSQVGGVGSAQEAAIF